MHSLVSTTFTKSDSSANPLKPQGGAQTFDLVGTVAIAVGGIAIVALAVVQILHLPGIISYVTPGVVGGVLALDLLIAYCIKSAKQPPTLVEPPVNLNTFNKHRATPPLSNPENPPPPNIANTGLPQGEIIQPNILNTGPPQDEVPEQPNILNTGPPQDEVPEQPNILNTGPPQDDEKSNRPEIKKAPPQNEVPDRKNALIMEERKLKIARKDIKCKIKNINNSIELLEASIKRRTEKEAKINLYLSDPEAKRAFLARVAPKSTNPEAFFQDWVNTEQKTIVNNNTQIKRMQEEVDRLSPELPLLYKARDAITQQLATVNEKLNPRVSTTTTTLNIFTIEE